MKTLLAGAALWLFSSLASHAVTWHVVSVSAVVKQSSQGKVTTTLLNARKYREFVSAEFAVPMNDLFVGFREDTGQVSVVRISTETVLYNIVSGIGAGGTATNGTNTQFFVSAPAVVSSLNTDFQGYIYDTAKRFTSGSLRSVTRTFMGGFQDRTIKGTIRKTGKKFEL